MGMCWAPDCKHYSNREMCKFFTFPKDVKIKEKWLKLLRRKETPGAGARVCSCHFKDGKKESLPELYVHNVGMIFKKHHLSPEKQKSRRRVKRKLEYESEPVPGTSSMEVETTGVSSTSQELNEESSPIHFEADVTEVVIDHQTTTTFTRSATAESESYLLNLELEKKDEIISTLKSRFSYMSIAGNDKLVLLYTGLPTTHIFETFCALLKTFPINYYLNWKVKNLSQEDQILLTFMKLRHNFCHEDLAVRFNVSKATVTNIVLTYLHLLHNVLFAQFLDKVPSRQKNKSCLPNCFSTFTNCRIIIDCTEIFTAVSRKSLKKQRATYSSYKHRNTWKGLVGVAPNGVVTYASGLFAGSTSDKKIVEKCGITKCLTPGDLVLADKGFLIKDLLPAGVDLNIPPFLSTPQFTREQIFRTRTIAKARIHVERAIRRMKVYKIQDFIPYTLFQYATIIFQTVAALTNLQYPLIKEVEELYCEDEAFEEHSYTSKN